MTKLWHIPGFTMELYREMKDEGYIKVRFHPEQPLAIANYSDKTQIDRVWNQVTRNCRGIIFNVYTNEIVAKPFSKFFNYGEPEVGKIDLDEPVEVTDKVDGSLGIIYPVGDGSYAVATRGSFTSDQAIKGTQILQTNYPDFVPPPGFTVLVEIVFPENRIVLDYGDQEDLILLGAVADEGYRYEPLSGRFWTYGPNAIYDWEGPRTDIFEYPNLTEALAAPPRKNAEGLVVRFVNRRNTLVKIKQTDYVALHRLVFGLNERVVWEHLKNNDGDYQGLLEGLPDEFHGWVKDKAESLLLHYSAIEFTVAMRYREAFSPEHPERWDRKGFAEWATNEENKQFAGLLFMRLDGKDISQAIWKRLKPVGHTEQLKVVSEDVA